MFPLFNLSIMYDRLVWVGTVGGKEKQDIYICYIELQSALMTDLLNLRLAATVCAGSRAVTQINCWNVLVHRVSTAQ